MNESYRILRSDLLQSYISDLYSCDDEIDIPFYSTLLDIKNGSVSYKNLAKTVIILRCTSSLLWSFRPFSTNASQAASHFAKNALTIREARFIINIEI